MVVTKAARSQRARRAAEARAAQELTIQEPIKKKKKEQGQCQRKHRREAYFYRRQ